MRGQGHTAESVCRVLREQGCQIAARTYRSWRTGHVAARTRTDAEAAATSARIQGAGYLAATFGPPLIGR